VKVPGPGRGRGPRRSNGGPEGVDMGEIGEGEDYDDEELGEDDLGGEGDQSIILNDGVEEEGIDGEDVS